MEFPIHRGVLLWPNHNFTITLMQAPRNKWFHHAIGDNHWITTLTNQRKVLHELKRTYEQGGNVACIIFIQFHCSMLELENDYWRSLEVKLSWVCKGEGAPCLDRKFCNKVCSTKKCQLHLHLQRLQSTHSGGEEILNSFRFPEDQWPKEINQPTDTHNGFDFIYLKTCLTRGDKPKEMSTKIRAVKKVAKHVWTWSTNSCTYYILENTSHFSRMCPESNNWKGISGSTHML